MILMKVVTTMDSMFASFFITLYKATELLRITDFFSVFDMGAENKFC